MADGRRYALNLQLGIEQILKEAQHRWLRPAEICEILRNYRKFDIAPEAPNKPPSGSIYLFDRKVLRYFRKDGHNWRKKKDGKTVKEAHERLKAESIDVLHCYYAHGEENESFQRRTYWMLEEAFMHIVLVHYLEVKGGKACYSRSRDDNEISRLAQVDSPVCSNSFASQDQVPSRTADAGSPSSVKTSELEDAQSDNYQARSGYHPFLGLQQFENGHLMDVHLLNSNVPISSLTNQFDHQISQALTPETDFYSACKENMTKVFNGIGIGLGYSDDRTQFGLPAWDEVLEHNAKGVPITSTSLEIEAAAVGGIPKQVTLTFGELLSDVVSIKQQDNSKSELQVQEHPDVDPFASSKVNVKREISLEGNMNTPPILKQSSLGLSVIEGEGLKKYDSFSKWVSREFAEVDDSHMKSALHGYWNFMDSEHVDDSGIPNPEQDAFIVGPSVSQDQLFSIIDFSPNWAYSGMETKVLITGIFLKDKKDVYNIKLSCMFGEVEVPAEILADGILRCHAPPQKSGRVHFYVTCSNRLACSEVREFEYRVNHAECMETSDLGTCKANEMYLHVRLGKLLSLGSMDHSSVSSNAPEKVHIRNKISSLLMEPDDKWFNMLKLSNDIEFSPDRVKDQLLQKLLKEKLHDWLIHKVAEDGKGPNVLDKEGQGVIHLAAALGYDWAIKPIITAGVSINFRDVRGWTALHWAAFCGRERTVVSLVTLHADSGALTDPTLDFPSGRTPADLASGNGHKGLAGFLAESSLTSHLSALTIKNTRGIDMTDVLGIEDIGNLEEQSQLIDGETEAGPSLKESLCAVRNATLAAARIHQVFRADSFQRKKLVEYGDDQCGISEEQALSLISIKRSKPGQHDMPVHAAAIRIQNKYRGWKGRKEFLITRQRIVTIQAHVRGHQVRKRYKKIVWTVGIWEKAVLRWRRKGSGLRGFRSKGFIEGTSMQTEPAEEDDYDFLKEGRKQTEARMDKALARVRSMVQYPEARDQYRRLLTVVTELQGSNVTEDKILNESLEAAEGDFMRELEELCEDDPFMSSV